MKQFNLEEYLANPSKKVVTRDGRDVRIVCTDRKSEEQPIVALIASLTEENEDSEYVGTYGKDGRWSTSGCASELDLIFAPEKHEGWVNIYKAGAQRETLGCLVTRYVGSSIWPTEEAAKTAADADNIVTIKIEWEE